MKNLDSSRHPAFKCWLHNEINDFREGLTEYRAAIRTSRDYHRLMRLDPKSITGQEILLDNANITIDQMEGSLRPEFYVPILLKVLIYLTFLITSFTLCILITIGILLIIPIDAISDIAKTIILIICMAIPSLSSFGVIDRWGSAFNNWFIERRVKRLRKRLNLATETTIYNGI